MTEQGQSIIERIVNGRKERMLLGVVILVLLAIGLSQLDFGGQDEEIIAESGTSPSPVISRQETITQTSAEQYTAGGEAAPLAARASTSPAPDVPVRLIQPAPWQDSATRATETQFDSTIKPLSCLIEAGAISTLGSSVGGIVKTVLIERGDEVANDQILIELESELEKLDVELALARAENDAVVGSAEARLEEAKSQLLRQQELYSRKVTSTALLEQAQAEASQARHALDDALSAWQITTIELKRAETAATMRRITSPFDGVVVEVNAEPGEYVDELTEVAVIARIDPLHVQVYAPVSMFGLISVGDAAQIMPEAPIGGRYEARIKSIDRVIDAASSTFVVMLELQNRDKAIPAGLVCHIEFTAH